MAKCFSFTATQDSCYRYSFTRAGLKSSTTDLGDGTIMHCWIPKKHNPSKRTLLLIHGFGANAMWQFNGIIPQFMPKFNVYVPDLLFFGESYTSRAERSESFQAQCVMSLMEAQNVTKMDVFGLSYGGFVAYSMAAQFRERVGRVVLGCAGVCFEEKDIDEGGVFKVVTSIEEAAEISSRVFNDRGSDSFLSLSVGAQFHCAGQSSYQCSLSLHLFLMRVMCTEFRQEKEELIQTLHKNRKMSDLPKITQPTLIIWGEHDQVFPLELAHRLKRHIGDNAELVVIKNVGHALNVEKPKELYKHLKSFFIDNHPSSKQASHGNGP
ncbi:hypothetical protein OIU84_006428 [Salix udensis]|uniref:AB hydrolase-1 domain-containing protein n=1 Tax=Salix udensis TaxID=889485 RepID=A0AAD6P2D5_9ROSI|nr:hypothetical protein OIU84_006428 [Salix udensis]